jgi:hypothetical protein
MTWCVSIIDRASAGLKPERELTTDDYAHAASRYKDSWTRTGTFTMPGAALQHVTDWCAPILDHETPTPDLNREVRWPEDDDPATEAYADEPAWRAFITRYAHVLAAESPIGHRHVPAWKFHSNDPWQFTPRECGVLAYHLRAAPVPSGDAPVPSGDAPHHEWLPDLGEFFGWCAQHGGAAVS